MQLIFSIEENASQFSQMGIIDNCTEVTMNHPNYFFTSVSCKTVSLTFYLHKFRYLLLMFRFYTEIDENSVKMLHENQCKQNVQIQD